uniref:NADH-ubiquinone oxidoreductase chain 5 n=1 Tax=Cofana yasumatsui TaxID=2741154 RepID=A0A6M8PN59_9HEMI|nr:NADH dehydrogenase subunit 5 [Cofana yasumatsui]QKG63362.1 NADH dehydrogenase subunit 5 [Cofana yasumatsui]
MIKFNFYFYWFIIFLLISFLFFFTCLYFMIFDLTIMMEWKLLSLNSVSLYYTLILDWISLSFCFVVTFISSMVLIYSMEYMGYSTNSSVRFLFMVILFIISMILMIISPNLISILLGWDGLGLVSYCLVIYYSSLMSYLAGMITCLTNRVGDIGLLISVCWMMSFGSWHFIFYKEYFGDCLFYMIFISSFTKSAQIPFSCWLPAAMAAPTPVSSLVHSSTLVTAGVYLLIRFFYIISYLNFYFLFVSIMTMVFSSFCAIYEFDLKKIIALSTLSQLGLMMSSLFLGLLNLSFFHLLSHAMFKSLLFLCSGIYIFYMNDNQDIRLMGSISFMMPFTSSCFNISNLTLCGIPFLSGFFSKDSIIEFMMMSKINLFLMLIYYMSLGLTCCYSFRLFYYSMVKNSNFVSFSFIFDELVFMKFSILLLTFFSISFGSIFMWLMNFDFDFILLPKNLKYMPMLMVFLGIWLGLEFTSLDFYLPKYFYLMNGNMWFMTNYYLYLYKISYVYSYFMTSNSLLWGDYLGAEGINFYILKFSNYLQHYSMSSMKIFLLSFVIWFIILI